MATDQLQPGRLLDRLLAGTAGAGPPPAVTHVERQPARGAETVPWPLWAPASVVDRFRDRGVALPWSHQAAAASLAHDGRSVVVATGTASGKSLAYQLPAAALLARTGQERVLYLAPTKALAADQLRSLVELDLPGVRPATLDGDSPREQRDWVRAHANWVLSNPDLLSRTVLPQHARWAPLLRRLRYVVIDECHAYRGVFGSHVAQVLRRLRRLCTRYGAAPVFVLASATVARPAAAAARLVGLPADAVEAVDHDGSPRGPRTVVLWEPPLDGTDGSAGGADHAATRRPAGVEAGRLLADLMIEGARTVAFVRSRRGAEFTALGAARALSDAGALDLAGRVAAYRAGYLPEERRSLEAALTSGRLLGLASTNALELGVDVSGLDAVVIAGFPGTLASFWQQAGRAGRAGQESLVVFVARDDPLDTYLVRHPSAIFGRPVEATVIDPGNPHVLAPQLCCAAAEAPIRDDELGAFATDVVGTDEPGSDVDAGRCARSHVRRVLDELVADGVLRRRPAGWFWTSTSPPRVDLRSSGGAPVQVVDAATGALIGTVDPATAHSTVHEGAVYVHRGRTYVVETFDPDPDGATADGATADAGPVALVRAQSPPWSTTAHDITDLRIDGVRDLRRIGPLTVAFGSVEVSGQVVAYARHRLGTGEFLGETELSLPPRRLRTAAVWYSVPQEVLDAAGLPPADVPGAVHAAEHAAIGLLPLFATCDRWDIGGVSTALHPDTGQATVFVYDGHPGGAGFAERGHAELHRWLRATRDVIADCDCRDGCPSCVQSPKCGNGNEPLSTSGAVRWLDVVLGLLDGRGLLAG